MGIRSAELDIVRATDNTAEAKKSEEKLNISTSQQLCKNQYYILQIPVTIFIRLTICLSYNDQKMQ